MRRDRAAWGRVVRALSEPDDGGERLQTCYRFDGLSNLTEVWAGPTTDTTSIQCNFADSALKLQQSSTWDDFGNELSRTDALGRTWQFRYDYYGQLESSQTPEPAAASARIDYRKTGRWLMSRLVDYERLLEQFLGEAMPVEEFQVTYLDRFKNEGLLDEPLFELLDELFGDVDSFTTDPQLLAENPSFYLDEAGLRQKVRQAAVRLSDLKR
jgi:YD repeat-containing protein